MEYVKLKTIAKFPTGKLNSNAAMENGEYPFFTCSHDIYRIDKYAYDGEYVLLGGNNAAGDFPIFYYNGKFEAYQRTYLIQPIDRQQTNTRFLYYAIGLKLALMKGNAAGTATKFLTQPILNNIAIEKFDIIKQNKIVDLLSKYDDLIENNNKRIKILEQMAENLYKEWFVRFRFPGHETTEFEKGLPKGWCISSVKNCFEIFDTERVPLSSMERDKMEKIYPYYGAAELMDYVDDYLFDGVYLLLGEDGSVITPKGKPMLQYVWGKLWVNNHAHVLQGKAPFTTEYLHLMFGQMDVTGIVTGSAQPKISQGRLFKKKTMLPPSDIIEKFNLLIQPIYQEIRKLNDMNQNLIKQRDMLLPHLMSGKLEMRK